MKDTNRAINDYKAMALAFIVLAALLFGYILSRENPFSVFFPLPEKAEKTITPGDVKVYLSDPSVAAVTSISIAPPNLHVQLIQTGRGTTSVTISCPDVQPGWERSFTLQALPFQILYDRENGNFSGWQAIALFNTLFFIVSTVILVIGFCRAVLHSFFSYHTITHFALGLFMLLLSVRGMIVLISYYRDPAVEDLNDAIAVVSESAADFITITTPLLVVFLILLFISNLMLIRKEGSRPVNLFGIALTLVMAAGLLLATYFFRINTDSLFVNSLISIYSAVYMFFECMIFALLVVFLLIPKRNPTKDKDCIIILGCAIRHDGTLFPLIRGRVDKALEFAEQQKKAGGPEPFFIPSGGQGVHEPLPEGQAIANYLIKRGIPENRIFPDNSSANTRENFQNARKIADSLHPEANVLFSTSNYHVFRSGIIARELGWEPDGIGCKTKWYFWPNALVREFIGLLRSKWVKILIMLVILIVLSVMTTILAEY